MLHRNGKEIEQIFRNGREIALLYKNGVIIYDKRGNIQPSTQYTITYVNGESNNSDSAHIRTIAVPVTETITTDSYTIPNTGQFDWDEHAFLGYSETQYPTYSNVATTVYAPGTEITVDHDMTLYPVWNTTFQGLINEGYVTITTDKTYFDSACQPLSVAPNHYPKELVIDFNDVFYSTNNKMVSTEGVVGDGTYPNVFMFNSANHWLTDDELYTLYNNNTLPHWPQNNQFSRVNWGSYNNMTMIFRGIGTPFNNTGGTQNTFFRYGAAPKNLTIDLGTETLKHLNVAFRRNNLNGLTPESVTFVGLNGNPIRVTGAMQGAFESCVSLRNLSGLDIGGATNISTSSTAYGNLFQNCSALTTLSSALAPNGTNSAATAMNNMFKYCTNLTSIGFILNVANITANTDVFAGCNVLTTLYLNGINAQKNQNWDLSATSINSSSIAYIVDNLTEITINDPETFEYKTIRFPSTSTLTEAQLIRLHNNGWNTYIGGTLVDLTEKTLTYSANGGTNPPAAQTFVLSTTVTSSVPTTPEDAESFLGWSDVPNATTATYTAGDVITSTMTLYAVWQYSGFRDAAAVGVSSVGSQSYLETEINFDTLVNYLSLQDLCKIKYRRSISDGEMTTLSFRVNRIDTTNKIIEGSFISPDSGGMTINEITIGSKSTTKFTLDNNSFVNKTGYDLIIFKVITG